jgi:hypothetical protein
MCQVTDPVFLPCRPVRRAISPPVQFGKSTSPPVLCNMDIADSNRYILAYIVLDYIEIIMMSIAGAHDGLHRGLHKMI